MSLTQLDAERMLKLMKLIERKSMSEIFDMDKVRAWRDGFFINITETAKILRRGKCDCPGCNPPLSGWHKTRVYTNIGNAIARSNPSNVVPKTYGTGFTD